MASSLSLVSPTSPSSTSNNIVSLVSVKLDQTNHLLRKSQLLAIFCTHDLLGYIDGTKPCPPATIVNDKVSSPNPDYLSWVKQDQHIASWLMATLSEPILSQVVSPDYISAQSLWSKLQNLCVISSKLHIIQIRGQLQALKKNSTPMSDYIELVKKLSNQLASMGSPLSDADLFYYILGGLGADYEAFVTTVSLQSNTIPFEELCTLLRNQELRLASLHNDSPPVHALTATHNNSSVLGHPPSSPSSQ